MVAQVGVGGVQQLSVRVSTVRRLWLRAVAGLERMRQWRWRVASVRRQPEILAAVLWPRMAVSDPLLVAGTSKRVARTQIWSVLRCRRRASCRSGWLPLCHRRDRLVEIAAAVPLS